MGLHSSFICLSFTMLIDATIAHPPRRILSFSRPSFHGCARNVDLLLSTTTTANWSHPPNGPHRRRITHSSVLSPSASSTKCGRNGQGRRLGLLSQLFAANGLPPAVVVVATDTHVRQRQTIPSHFATPQDALLPPGALSTPAKEETRTPLSTRIPTFARHEAAPR